MWSSWRDRKWAGGGDRNTGSTRPSVTLSTRNPTRSYLGLKPVRRGWERTTNRPNYGAAWDLNTAGKIILKFILHKYDIQVWNAITCFRIRSSGVLLRAQKWPLWFHTLIRWMTISVSRRTLLRGVSYNISAFRPRASGRRPLFSFTLAFSFLLILLAYLPYLEKNKRTFLRLPYCLCIPPPPIFFFVFCAVWVASNGSR